MRPDLAPFFAPKSVAVLGAGERPTSSGGAVLQNLRKAAFAGQVIPVNAKGGTIFGLPARRSLAELESPADLVVIVIRPDLILEAVDAAALRALVRQHGLVVTGPNCAGIIHLPANGRFAATFLRDLPPGPNTRGGVALISQSGALAEEAIAAANARRLPLGTVVS